jgi:hypothetical protein
VPPLEARFTRTPPRRATRPAPHSQILQKKAEFCCLPGSSSSSRQQSAQGRQTGKARHGLAELPHLPYIVNLGVTTELPTDHKALPNFHHLPFKGWGPRGQCFPPGSCGPSSSFPPGQRERGKERERQRRLRQKQTCGPLLDACLPLIIGTSQFTQYIHDVRFASVPPTGWSQKIPGFGLGFGTGWHAARLMKRL